MMCLKGHKLHKNININPIQNKPGIIHYLWPFSSVASDCGCMILSSLIVIISSGDNTSGSNVGCPDLHNW